jgi:hypothetical protein
MEFGHPPIVGRTRVDAGQDPRAVEILCGNEAQCITAHGSRHSGRLRHAAFGFESLETRRRLETVLFEHDVRASRMAMITPWNPSDLTGRSDQPINEGRECLSATSGRVEQFLLQLMTLAKV